MSRTRTASKTARAGKKLKVSYQVHVAQHGQRLRLLEGAPSEPAPEPEPQGVVPRVSRLLALAHHIQELLDTGQVKDLAEVARRGNVTRARVTQIMNLLLLAPDIQEEILFLPRTKEGGDKITERGVRTVIGELSFANQRSIWHRMVSPTTRTRHRAGASGRKRSSRKLPSRLFPRLRIELDPRFLQRMCDRCTGYTLAVSLWPAGPS